MDTIYIKPGLKIHKFEDESVDIIAVATITLLSPAEFNALALHSPLVRDILALAKDWKREDSYCPWCNKEIGQGVPHAPTCPRQKLLAEIAELEKQG